MRAFVPLLPALVLALAAAQPGSSPDCRSCCWFREQVTLQQASLPQGVSVSAIEASSTERAGMRIENHTAELLFVLSRQYQEQLSEPVTPDPQYEARLRYAHEVASYLVPPEGQRPLSLFMPALLDLDPALQELNRLDASRPPAAEAALPAAQDSMLLLVHGANVYRLPFTISYALNPDYDPAACGEHGTGTSAPAGTVTPSLAGKRTVDLQRGLPGLALLFLVAAALLGASLLARRPPG